MESIGLNDSEILQAKRTARDLHEYWKELKPQNRYQTLSGMYAEMAVVKYFNRVLGATPSIKFNTEYREGRDGGFDFECCGLKFDVKNDNSAKIKTANALSTSANVVIGTTRLREAKNFHTYAILGFIPVTRIKRYQEFLTQPDFADLLLLARARPDVFKGKISGQERQGDPMCIGDVLQIAIEKITP